MSSVVGGGDGGWEGLWIPREKSSSPVISQDVIQLRGEKGERRRNGLFGERKNNKTRKK